MLVKKVLNQKQFVGSKQTTIQMYNDNGDNITTEDVKNIIERFKTGKAKILVRGLNIERWCSLKGFEDEFDADAFEEYYYNKLKEADVGKFTTFKQLQISVLIPNKLN
jgi:hypothetical protein